MTQVTYSSKGPSTELEHAEITSVKADVVKKEIKITIVLPLNEITLLEANELARLVHPDMPELVNVSIQPIQPRLIE